MLPDDEPTRDVKIAASTAADELRSHAPPEVGISSPGTGERDCRQSTVRRNIDTPVQSGKPYHRVVVTTRISSRIVDGLRLQQHNSRRQPSPAD